jgi:Flp pilus assembly pilin Flp
MRGLRHNFAKQSARAPHKLTQERLTMKLALRRIWADERGAVTVDWVILAAATVGLGLLVLIVIAPAVQAKSDTIAKVLVQ